MPAITMNIEALERFPIDVKHQSDEIPRQIAFEVQSKTYGGLDQQTRRILKQYEQSHISNKAIRIKANPLVQGSRILREWKGVTHLVIVTDQGYEWQGKTYRSLSAIAKEITGTHWSGPRFFCLKDKQPNEENA